MEDSVVGDFVMGDFVAGGFFHGGFCRWGILTQYPLLPLRQNIYFFLFYLHTFSILLKFCARNTKTDICLVII